MSDWKPMTRTFGSGDGHNGPKGIPGPPGFPLEGTIQNPIGGYMIMYMLKKGNEIVLKNSVIPVECYDAALVYLKEKDHVFEEGEFERFISKIKNRSKNKMFVFIKDILNEITNGRITVRSGKNAAGKI